LKAKLGQLRQTVHTHCASVHQAAKLVAALLRVPGVTVGLAESNGSLPFMTCITDWSEVQTCIPPCLFCLTLENFQDHDNCQISGKEIS